MRISRRATTLVVAIALCSSVPAWARERDETIREFLKDAAILGFAALPSGEWLVSSNSLYRSVDSGKTWTRVGPQIDMGGALHLAPDGGLYTMGTSFFSPDGKVTLPKDQRAVGLYRSRDAGATWSVLHTWKSSELEPLALLRTPTGTLLLGSGALFEENSKKGILRSTDDGKTWVLGKSEALVFSFEVAADGTLYAASDDGVLASTDDGASWTTTGHTQMTPLVRTQDGVLLAGSLNGLYRSTDKGKTWAVSDSFREHVALPIVVAKDKIAAVAQSMTTSEVTLLLSRDGGQTWKTAPGKIAPMVVDVVFSDGKALYLGARRQGILRSGNDGESFEKVFP
jgi:photosystem II stability/assembly factor-like uncharacterized protein